MAAYDAALIARCLEDLARDETQWRLWFARNGILPLVLEHEPVTTDPAAAVGAVAAFLKVEGAITPDPSRIDLEIQADAETALWRRRFLDDHRGGALRVHQGRPRQQHEGGKGGGDETELHGWYLGGLSRWR